MAFELKKFFQAIFKPAKGETVTVMIDVPAPGMADSPKWKELRQMAQEWHQRLRQMAPDLRITVNPLVRYDATGSHNADLPQLCLVGDHEMNMKEVMAKSTIVISMPYFSASAPLLNYTKQLPKLRVGSMPRVERFMEETGLSADYDQVAKRCMAVASVFDQGIGAEVIFSTGHRCFFDLPMENKAMRDDGILHPDRGGTNTALSNLPAGEVLTVPNENDGSVTAGELPHQIGDELVVYQVKNNRICNVNGDGEHAQRLRKWFAEDPARQNIAEFAIGLNEKAKVTGNILEDEKAGFHWAYGRSDHIGGKLGIEDFKSPDQVIHMDIAYAKESPIICTKLDIILSDHTRKTLILDGELQI